MTFQQLVCLLHAHYTCCKKNKICIHVWPHDCLPPLNVWIRSSTMPRLKITDTQVNFQWTFSGIHGNPFMHSVVPRAIHCFSMCVWSTVKRIIHASVRDHEKKWDSRPLCRQTFWVSLCPTPALWAGHSSAALQSASLRFFYPLTVLSTVQKYSPDIFFVYIWTLYGTSPFHSFYFSKHTLYWFYWQKLDHQLVKSHRH